jgi:hypothetical protein
MSRLNPAENKDANAYGDLLIAIGNLLIDLVRSEHERNLIMILMADAIAAGALPHTEFKP